MHQYNLNKCNKEKYVLSRTYNLNLTFDLYSLRYISSIHVYLPLIAMRARLRRKNSCKKYLEFLQNIDHMLNCCDCSLINNYSRYKLLPD